MVKATKWVIRVLLFLLFIYLLVTVFNWNDFLAAGTRFVTEPEIFLFIFLCYLGSFFLKAIAWRLYFRRHILLSSSLYGIFYSLLINHLLPFKVGDIVRSMVLSSREKEVTLEESFHSVFILRVMDIVSLGLLVGVGSLFIANTLSFSILSFLFILLFGILAIFVVKKKFPLFFKRNVKLLAQAFAGWNGVLLFLLVVGSWILEGAVLLGVGIIMGEALTPYTAVWVNSITIIGQTFQFTPGGVSTYETIMTYALTFLNIPVKQGVLIALYTHIFKFIFSYLVGIYVYIRYPITLNTLKSWLSLKGVKQTQHEKRI